LRQYLIKSIEDTDLEIEIGRINPLVEKLQITPKLKGPDIFFG